MNTIYINLHFFFSLALFISACFIVCLSKVFWASFLRCSSERFLFSLAPEMFDLFPVVLFEFRSLSKNLVTYVVFGFEDDDDSSWTLDTFIPVENDAALDEALMYFLKN